MVKLFASEREKEILLLVVFLTLCMITASIDKTGTIALKMHLYEVSVLPWSNKERLEEVTSFQKWIG